MKLVFVSPTYPLRGGIARYGAYLLGHLQKRHDCLGLGFSRLYPAFLFPGKGEKDPDPRPPSGSEAQPLLHYAHPATWRRAARVIESFSPEGIILTWWVTFWAPYLAWLARKLSPRHSLIYLCHNVLPHENRFFDPLLTRWALQPGRGFLVHSAESQQQLTKLIPTARIVRREHPIYNDISGSLLSREEARQKLGITGRLLLFFGIVRPYKGLDIALQALARLKDEYPDLTLWVSGEFWDKPNRYEKLIEEFQLHGRVRLENRFLSQLELDLRLAACDGVILPYRSATGSGVLATAYGHDRPVIATRTGCFREMVLPGETGILCEPNDSDSLAQGIREFYQDPGISRFQMGLKQVREQFSWDNLINGLEELLAGG